MLQANFAGGKKKIIQSLYLFGKILQLKYLRLIVDIDLLIGNTFIRVKFVEIIDRIDGRNGKNWPTLLNFETPRNLYKKIIYLKGY